MEATLKVLGKYKKGRQMRFSNERPLKVYRNILVEQDHNRSHKKNYAKKISC